MTKKPKTKTTKPTDAAYKKTLELVKELRAENKALRKELAEYKNREVIADLKATEPEAVRVAVGPLMPWETALPNSFEAKS